MKIEVTETKEVEVKYLQVKAGARYWEDATVNGTEDKEGDLIPCRDGDYWKPLIDLETGKILNWEQGKKAHVHYKVCDDGTYQLLNEKKEIVKEIDRYVPSILCPKDNGYGDYVILDINEEGIIDGWKAGLEDFKDE